MAGKSSTASSAIYDMIALGGPLSYSPIQLGKIREALERYKRLGSGIPGKELTWGQMIGEIELFTSYSVLRPRTKGAESERGNHKNDTEALRQFVRGRTKRKTKYRAISKQLMSAIIDFLTHPEIKILSLDEIIAEDIPLILASSIKEYMLKSDCEKQTDLKFGLNNSQYRGISYSSKNDVNTLTGSDDLALYVLSHNYINFRECADPCIRIVELITTSPIWHRLPADSELPEFMLRHQTGPGRATPGLEINVIETTYIGVAVITSPISALCLLKDNTGKLAKSLWILKVPCDEEIEKLLIINSSAEIDISNKDSIILEIIREKLFESEDIRSSFENSPLRDLAKIAVLQNSLLFESVTSDYLFLDNYKKDMMSLIETFDPYRQQTQSDDQEQQEQQCQEQQFFEEEILEDLGEYLSVRDEYNKASIDLIRRLENFDVKDIWSFYHDGARFDLQSPLTGKTALHLLANMGWRAGIKVALRDKSRCDFTLRDKRGRLASYYATVYGRDPVISRLLYLHEGKSGANDGLPIRKRPFGQDPL